MTDRVTYSIDELSKRTGLSRSFLYTEIKAGKLRTLKLGKRRLVHRDDEAAYLASQRPEAA